MRATDGSVSARFQTLRLPTGAGLGGLVAQTRRPYWTADYPADARYRHTTPRSTPRSARRGWSRSAAPRCWWTASSSGCSSPRTAAAARSAATRWRCSARWPRWPRCRWCRPSGPPRPPRRWPRCRSAHTAIEQAAAAHDRFAGVVLGGGGVDDIAAALGELLGCWVAVLDADEQRLAAHGAVPDGRHRTSAGRLPGGAPVGARPAGSPRRRDVGGGRARGRAAAGHAGARRPGPRSTTGRAAPWSGRPW